MCCGKPLDEEEKEFCRDCTQNKKVFYQGRSLWVHRDLVKKSIYKFKYKSHRVYAKTYAKLLVEENLDFLEYWKPDYIIPIPIHAHRRKIRGYNQSEVLSEAICSCFDTGVSYKTDWISRRKETAFQKTLDYTDRRKNLDGAFEYISSERVHGTVLVVDDIYTTGATIQEIAKILNKRGAEAVIFLTISIGQGF